MPEFALTSPAYASCRWLAALVAVLCLVMTARCWARMGKDWRMAIAVGEKTNVITDGPFRRIRHPIYAFQILLMICTLIVVPTLPMLLVALVHFTVMNVKARSEERYLLQTQPRRLFAVRAAHRKVLSPLIIDRGQPAIPRALR